MQTATDFLAIQAALAGQYSLQRELGRGGMGVVYLAREVELDRDVAIKVLPAHMSTDPLAREQFLREARTAAGLSHPHIVPIHRVGEAGGFVYFAMGYVEGETLGERLRTLGPLPPVEAARVLREVAWALAYAHGRGIVHGDVKPDNILLEGDTGRALVSDFGIAHGGGHSGVGGGQGVTGTVHFMSPEQVSNGAVDGRADLYSLGVVGYLAVSGRLPFDEPQVPALLLRRALESAPTVATAAPGLPPALGTAIDRCLARDPTDRFPDGESLAAVLAPKPDTRPPLPARLRAWLGAQNKLLIPYMGWSAGFSLLTVMNFVAWLAGNPGSSPVDFILLAGLATAPMWPILGFHLHQARRQFKAGHSLADLRSALEVARREQEEADAVVRADEESAARRALRVATIGSATWLIATCGMIVEGMIQENRGGIVLFLVPLFSTMLLGAVSNALDVQFIPTRIRNWWQTGIRDRLWNSRVGEWLAGQLGAPERTNVAGEAAFRATESALGIAAAELYRLLPETFRGQLPELPATVAALEAHATDARAELDVLAALRPHDDDAEILAARRDRVRARLADSVAALETIRLDLLRLHANAHDMAPLNTLMDAALLVSEDVKRLTDAKHEVDDVWRSAHDATPPLYGSSSPSAR